MYGSKQISSRCGRAAVVSNLKQIRFRMVFKQALLGWTLRVTFPELRCCPKLVS